MKNRIKVSIRGILLLACFALISPASCERDASRMPADAVTVQLKWLHQAQFAGFYVAREKGYYARENLNVTFLEGGVGVDMVERLASGRADFGVLTPEFIFSARSRGALLTGIAAIYRRSAVVFAAMADSGIVRPSDFMGKTVAAGDPGGSQKDFELQFYAMMKKLGLDASRVKVIPYDPAYTAFYNGRVEITPCYSTGGLIKMREKGLKLNLIWPADYGIHFYSDTLCAREDTIREKPDLVARFLRATLRGWQDAVEDYETAVSMTMKYARNTDPVIQTPMMEALLPLVHTGEGRIGWMQGERWESMYEMFRDQGLIARPFDVHQAYTLRFLEEVYNEKPE